MRWRAKLAVLAALLAAAPPGFIRLAEAQLTPEACATSYTLQTRMDGSAGSNVLTFDVANSAAADVSVSGLRIAISAATSITVLARVRFEGQGELGARLTRRSAVRQPRLQPPSYAAHCPLNCAPAWLQTATNGIKSDTTTGGTAVWSDSSAWTSYAQAVQFPGARAAALPPVISDSTLDPRSREPFQGAFPAAWLHLLIG